MSEKPTLTEQYLELFEILPDVEETDDFSLIQPIPPHLKVVDSFISSDPVEFPQNGEN